jgi:hypothetical protein
MPIIIEFIENTNSKIQMWILKITYKLCIHKTKKHKLLKVQNAKTQTTKKTLNLNVG